MIKTANILKTTAIVTLLSASSLLLAGQHDGAGAEGKHYGDRAGGYQHSQFHGGPMHGERWLAHMGDKLQLSETQKADIKAIADESKAERESLRNASKEARQAEMTAIQARESERTLRKLARKSADARVDMMVHGFEMEKRIDAVLTEEQRDKLAAMKAERKTKMEERRQQRMERHQERMNKGASGQ